MILYSCGLQFNSYVKSPEQETLQVLDKLVLDYDKTTKEPLVEVDQSILQKLKSHQAEGIRFLWDNTFESIERYKNSSGDGCILAHCMGLGKTFQVNTTFVYIVQIIYFMMYLSTVYNIIECVERK